jgi:small subunit ribosomal protein S21|tara:strand:+ start:504 stop:701 length:198 start_codon:yes stop_codon:yes gene_type:complete
MGLKVVVRNNNVEFALKKMKQKVKDSNMMVELKERSFYTKPSTERRKKKNMAIAREKYRQKKQNK